MLTSSAVYIAFGPGAYVVVFGPYSPWWRLVDLSVIYDSH
jgi:hypothetical protein